VYKLASWKPSETPSEEDKGDKTIVSEKPTGAVNAPVPPEKRTLKESAEKIWDEMGVDEKFPPPKQ